MQTQAEAQRIRGQVLVWWIIWFTLIGGLTMIYFTIPLTRGVPRSNHPIAEYFGFAPLFLSIVLRWFVMPRFKEAQKIFVIFILGLALAEGCGILGIFLGGPYRDELFVLSLFGMAQYVPFFARRLYEPRAKGFTSST